MHYWRPCALNDTQQQRARRASALLRRDLFILKAYDAELGALIEQGCEALGVLDAVRIREFTRQYIRLWEKDKTIREYLYNVMCDVIQLAAELDD